MNDIQKCLTALYPSFSKGQKKIANAVLTEYDKVAYMTALTLSNHVGVSESTVVRFAKEIGYEGYTDFQHAIQELVRTKLTPNQRIEITKNRIGEGNVLDRVMESDIERIRYSVQHIDRDAFYASVDSILAAKTVYIIGARSSEMLARLLSYNLSLIFDNIRFITPTSSSEVFEQMFSIGQGDVLIAFSFPRYSTKIVSAVKYARAKGAACICFTDSQISPLAEYATYLLTAQSDMASFMDSFTAPMSILNAIIVEITRRREAAIRKRFDSLESLWDEYGVYTKN